MSDIFRKGVVITPQDMCGYDWPEQMKRLGLNTLGLHLGGGRDLQPLENLERFTEGGFRTRMADLGLDLEFELHLGRLLLPRKLFETSPECFVFEHRSKRRIPDYNWCSSSDAAWKTVCANAIEIAAKLAPSTHRHFFWGDDDCPWCHCEECRNLSNSDQELRMANKLATALRAIDPLAQVSYLAYGKNLDLPENVLPEGNVFLELAPIHRCFNHPIDDRACSINRKYFDLLVAYRKLFPPERIHLLEYWLDCAMSSGWRKPVRKPLFTREVAARDLKAYHGLGIRSITTFAAYMDGEYFRSHGDRELAEYAELVNSLE